MKFNLSQQLGAAPERVITLLSDGEFQTSMSGLTKIGTPELLDRQVDGPLVTLQLRYRFIADLPSAVTAIVNPAKLTWIDETVYDLTQLTATTSMRPDHYEKRLSATIHQSYAAVGDSTERSIEGDLRVRALLVAGQVERAIVSGLSEHLDEERSRLETAL